MCHHFIGPYMYKSRDTNHQRRRKRVHRIMSSPPESKKKQHFVLVHGLCHGAWCWYKLATMLRSAGHRVTALDLAASGVHPQSIDDLPSFADYSRPLTDMISALPLDERVILVGHSFGGMNLALAMESFGPERISLAVFATAFMPGADEPLSVIGQEMFTRCPPESLMDSVFGQGPGQRTLLTFGPGYMSTMQYQLCPPEDLTLATMLVRAGSLFTDDKTMENILTRERYGSVCRAYIVCEEDSCITADFQHWMTTHSPEVEVKEIEGADHMVMLSKPKELCSLLMELAQKY